MSTAAFDDFLNEVEEYLEAHEDVLDGDGGRPRPNKAMSLLVELRGWRAELQKRPESIPWQANAYAKLGAVRDSMPSEHVSIVQDFIGNLDAALRQSDTVRHKGDEQP